MPPHRALYKSCLIINDPDVDITVRISCFTDVDHMENIILLINCKASKIAGFLNASIKNKHFFLQKAHFSKATKPVNMRLSRPSNTSLHTLKFKHFFWPNLTGFYLL